ncbi:MAG TPA: DinB family protein [Bryobacteraceae bacterium]|nr:DinB family protein [Bryobacteraceae bacterium]
MNELERTLTGDSAAAPAAHILEGLDAELVYRKLPNTPHTIYQELWHLAFWQQLSLDWMQGLETPYPATASLGFPPEPDSNPENWSHLRQRFLDGTETAATLTREANRLAQSIRCTSQPGEPVRTMTVREQLESLAAHNAYHLGRIVLLRKLNQAWPPV